MIDAKSLGHQPVLRLEHVRIAVVRESHVESIARFGGISMPDAVRQNNEVLRWIQKLAAIEKLTGKLIVEKLLAGASRAVQDQDGILHFASGAGDRLPQRPVMELDFARLLATAKLEIAEYVIAFERLCEVGRASHFSQQTGGQDQSIHFRFKPSRKPPRAPLRFLAASIPICS